MNKCLLLIVLFLVNSSAFAQTEKETIDLLCHKWKMTQMEEPGKEKTPVPPEEEVYLEIKTDGTLISTGFDKKEKGMWTYDHKTKTITTEVKNAVGKWELMKVTENELILKRSVTKEISMNVIWKKVD